MSNNQLTIASYEENLDSFVETRNQENTIRFSQWIVEQLAHVSESAKIAEVGAGPGYTADYLESLGYTIDCSDAAKSFVEFMQAHGRAAQQIDIVKQPIGQDYDVIIALNVLQHMSQEDLQRALRHISQALRPGGKFLFSITVGDGSEEWHDNKGGSRYFLNWPLDDLRQLLKSEKFVVTYEREVGYKNWVDIGAEKQHEN